MFITATATHAGYADMRIPGCRPFAEADCARAGGQRNRD